AASSINVALHSGSIVDTEDGNLTLLANQQPSPRLGNFHGIFVDGTVQSTGKGNVTLKGRAGKDISQSLMAGVKVTSKGRIAGGTEGTLRVEGQGGSGVANPFQFLLGQYGVHVEGGTIESKGAHVDVTGSGGEALVGGSHNGVHLNSGGKISAGGSGKVRVSGTGGKSGAGVQLLDAATTITSSGGNVSVRGVGGNNPNSSHNIGVRVGGGTITAGGSGTILVSGLGGTGNADSDGVRIESDGKITSSNETLTVVGEAGTPASSSAGIVVDSTISHTGSGSGIALIADSMTITSTASIVGGSNVVAIRPKTSTTGIDLGASTVAGKLALADAELDRITAAVLQIGDLNLNGPIDVTASISRPVATNVSLLTAGAVTANPPIDTSGGTLRVNQNGRLTSGEAIHNSGLDFLSAGNVTQTSGGFTTPLPVSVGFGSFKQLLFLSGLTVDNGRITTPGKVQAITKSGNVDLFLGATATDAAQRIAIPISQLVGASRDDEFTIPKGQAFEISLNAKQTFVPTRLRLAAGSSDVGLRMAGALKFTDLGGEGAPLDPREQPCPQRPCPEPSYPVRSARPAGGDVGEDLALDSNSISVGYGVEHANVDSNGKFAPVTMKLGGLTLQGNVNRWEFSRGSFLFTMGDVHGNGAILVFDGGQIDGSFGGKVSLTGEVVFTKADVLRLSLGRLMLRHQVTIDTLSAEVQGDKILIRGPAVVDSGIDLGVIDFSQPGS
ncbi:MAG: hypothetical protein HYV60_24705, partial [Planctomycetia bacterium]|nr:hypothetical protein [Planctomycetia bacterium]